MYNNTINDIINDLEASITRHDEANVKSILNKVINLSTRAASLGDMSEAMKWLEFAEGIVYDAMNASEEP